MFAWCGSGEEQKEQKTEKQKMKKRPSQQGGGGENVSGVVVVYVSVCLTNRWGSCAEYGSKVWVCGRGRGDVFEG